jgi:peptidoglycan/LPS O-acetylase OafA/YrhL
MVVIYHYTSRFFEIFKLPNTAFYKFSFGHLGVELFFMISGFVILMSLDKVSNGWEFIKKRFLRLYPSYWVAVLFTFAVLSIVGLPGRETTTVQALVNLTMLHEFFGIPHVDGVYWSLTVELSFYALVFLSLFFNKSLFIKWGWVLLLILSIIVFVKSASFFSSNTFILKYFHLFYAGSVFYAWRRKLLSVFLIIPLLLLTIFHEYLLHGLIFMKPILFFYLLFIALQFNLLRYFQNKVFLFLGFISYPLYLLHQNLGYLIIFHLTKFGVNFHIGLVIAVIVSVFLAWVLAKYIEPMIQKKLKALIRKLS